MARVKIVRSQAVRETHTWHEVEVPDEVLAQLDEEWSDERRDALLDPYLDYALADYESDGLDDRDLRLNVWDGDEEVI